MCKINCTPIYHTVSTTDQIETTTRSHTIPVSTHTPKRSTALLVHPLGAEAIGKLSKEQLKAVKKEY